jgi:hypothetical protein
VIFLTVVLQSHLHAFCEGGQAVAVRFLKCVAGESEAGMAALVSEKSDLVHPVWMLWPAWRDHVGNAQMYSWFSHVTTASNQDTLLCEVAASGMWQDPMAAASPGGR